MKIPSEWVKFMQDDPATTTPTEKQDGYPRYSNDIPVADLKLNREYREYVEYTKEQNFPENDIKRKEENPNIYSVSDIPDIPNIPQNSPDVRVEKEQPSFGF